MKLVNLTRKTIVARNLRIADSFFSRLKGLLGTAELPDGEALLLRPCNNIHMFGMRYAIDVAFVTEAGEVLKTVAELAPGRFAGCPSARSVVELPSGTLRKTSTGIGDLLVMAED
ncbi:MAG: DUF192 domain-containing protein [Veillonellaceae bacterium]|jgi:hypothetical protein|nr:DUF192 domain-containing protein [Veillonellaceae bacterium]